MKKRTMDEQQRLDDSLDLAALAAVFCGAGSACVGLVFGVAPTLLVSAGGCLLLAGILLIIVREI